MVISASVAIFGVHRVPGFADSVDVLMTKTTPRYSFKRADAGSAIVELSPDTPYSPDGIGCSVSPVLGREVCKKVPEGLLQPSGGALCCVIVSPPSPDTVDCDWKPDTEPIPSVLNHA
jgi:hypothetical protein